MSAKNFLEEMKKLLTLGWTQNTDARAKDGTSRNYFDDDATCWCMLGAMDKVSLRLGSDDRTIARALIVKQIAKLPQDERGSDYSVVQFNDHEKTTQEKVLKIIDAAIEECGK